MPHCVLEYAKELTQEVSPEQMMTGVFNACVQSQLFQTPDIKVRATAYDHYRVGEGNGRFLHVSLKILDGRSAEQKRQLSQSVLASLVALGLSKTEITVDVSDTIRDTYSKHRGD